MKAEHIRQAAEVKDYRKVVPDDHPLATEYAIPAGFRCYFVDGWTADKERGVWLPKAIRWPSSTGVVCRVGDLVVDDVFLAVPDDESCQRGLPMTSWLRVVELDPAKDSIETQWNGWHDGTREAFSLSASAEVVVWKSLE